MERSATKSLGWLYSVVMSFFLMMATVDITKVHASPVNNSPMNGTQLAWWGGYYHGGYYHGGYYRPGYRYYAPGYYRSGWYYNRGCHKTCWRNKWGNLRCATRCY